MSWGPLEEFASLFAPGMRHERQRRQELETLRDEEGNSADPPSTVDLDRGVAVIRLPRMPPDAAAPDPPPTRADTRPPSTFTPLADAEAPPGDADRPPVSR